jgi:tRNA threonylcarbamoyladenosine biosynthesis protein TsaB
MLVAIDTATRMASLAFYQADRVCSEESWLAEASHTVELVPNLARHLRRLGLTPDQLTGVAVATGPGSFTGLRIGLAVAKGLALGLTIPIVGISTLDILAYPQADRSLPTWAIVQAGRGRICTALYRRKRGRWQRLGNYQLTTIADLCAEIEGQALFCGEIDGEAVTLIRECLGERAVIASPASAMRRAGYLAELAWPRLERGETDDPGSLAPVYLHTPYPLPAATRSPSEDN